MFMSPALSRRRRHAAASAAAAATSPWRQRRREDELDLILPSPTTEFCGGGGGGGGVEESPLSSSSPLPNFKLTHKRVQQSLFGLLSSGYSELPSCADGRGLEGSPFSEIREEFVQTTTGRILVAVEGDSKKPPIITYPDLGLDHLSNYRSFLHSPGMSEVLESFCFYHVHAPGQDAGAQELPKDHKFPSMEALSEQVECVLHHYGLTTCVCLGVGLGANVLLRLARRRPRMVEGLISVNGTAQASGWLEWIYFKIHLRSRQNGSAGERLHQSIVEYLIWHHLGRPSDCDDARSGLYASLRQHFSAESNARNLLLLLDAFLHRCDAGDLRALLCPVLNLTGAHSPHVDATVVLNGRLRPELRNWIKFQDAAMLFEEQPAKVAQAIKLFLQQLGYIIKAKKNQTGTVQY